MSKVSDTSNDETSDSYKEIWRTYASSAGDIIFHNNVLFTIWIVLERKNKLNDS